MVLDSAGAFVGAGEVGEVVVGLFVGKLIGVLVGVGVGCPLGPVLGYLLGWLVWMDWLEFGAAVGLPGATVGITTFGWLV